MMAIVNLPTQRRAIAQSSLLANATRQENSNKSFRVLMDIGPHLCSSVDYRSPIPWPNSDGGLAEFRRSLRSVDLRPKLLKQRVHKPLRGRRRRGRSFVMVAHDPFNNVSRNGASHRAD